MFEEKTIKLKDRQREAYEYLARGDNILITGPGGTGKTSVIKMFIKNYENSRRIAVTSTTGTSALLINGTTFHSFLGIGYGTGSIESIVHKIFSWAWLRKRWL